MDFIFYLITSQIMFRFFFVFKHKTSSFQSCLANNRRKCLCPINCSPRASRQSLEGGAVSQLQQFNQRQLELGCQWPFSALYSVPTAFKRYQQELPALIPGWWWQWGREPAIHVWRPHTSEAKGNNESLHPAPRRRIQLFTWLMLYCCCFFFFNAPGIG